METYTFVPPLERGGDVTPEFMQKAKLAEEFAMLARLQPLRRR